ncbi:MAG: acetylserotonin O-methyltransferase [Candidatus Dormibacteraeota bacterium]|nr:acetylserotonin O-methyltransferase [Candidatus Dormibacteraeota bacterium]
MSDAGDRLYQMISGFRVTQMVRTAALLGICDALVAGPRDAVSVAAELHADPEVLRRLMRALTGLGVLTEADDRRFSNTAIGELLRKDIPGSMRNAAIALPSDANWEAWAKLPRGVADGSVPFELAHGRSMWEKLAGEPEAAARFNGFMAAQSAAFAPQLSEAFDFSRCRQVVDVGGGNGALIAGVLAANPSLRGTLFDVEAGLAGGEAYLRHQGVADRCELKAGDFFKSVPQGGDVYLLKLILHDWDDARATEILKSCRRAMRPGASLLVMDYILPERAVPGPREAQALTMDLHMFTLFGARERTEQELRAMLTQTGFGVDRVVPTSPQATIVATAV